MSVSTKAIKKRGGNEAWLITGGVLAVGVLFVLVFVLVRNSLRVGKGGREKHDY
jgi:hypothetical protein